MKLFLFFFADTKPALLFLSFLLAMSPGACRKEGPDCHFGLTITNKSDKKVLYALRLTYAMEDNKCRLDYPEELSPNASLTESRKGACWEEILSVRDFEFFIVDPDHFNQGFFYNCDSIEHYNTVLKHYILTKEDIEELKRNNFTITYR
jgi:hypothetical protein